MTNRKAKIKRAHFPGRFDLVIANRQRSRSVNTPLLRKMTAALLEKQLGIASCRLGVCLVGTTQITHLNETFLQQSGPTDVIAFDYGNAPANHMHAFDPCQPSQCELYGEIYICVSEAIKQARRFNTSWQAELSRYLVHGVLHLLGYDDQTPASRRKMKKLEDKLLRQIAREFPLKSIERQPGHADGR